MDLYNVLVEASYNASYEGEIDKSYSKLVIANSEEEAIDFVNEDLESENDTYSYAKAKLAYKIDFNAVKCRRKGCYYPF